MTDRVNVGRSSAVGSWGAVWLALALSAVSALSAILPYLHARMMHPNEPASVSVLYRHRVGDVQYFPFVAALSRGEFREFSVKEEVGSRVLSFPFASLLLHAGCFRVFGPLCGFALADAIVTVVYYWLLVAFFRSAGIPLGVASLFALLTACHFPPVIDVGIPDRTLPLISPIWGERFPRPFVSEVFVLGSMVALAFLVARGRRPGLPTLWVAFGSSLALVLQSDIYPAIPLAGASTLVLLATARRSPGRACLHGLTALAAFVLFCIPFLIQRVVEAADVPVRFGVFPVARSRPLIDWLEPLYAIPYLSVLWGAYAATRAFHVEIDRMGGGGRAESLAKLWLLLGVLVVLAHVAMPLSTVVLGKAIQPFQFPIRSRMFRSYAVLLCLAWGLDMVGRTLIGRLGLRRWFVMAPLAVGLSMSLLALTWRGSSGYDGHLRPEVYPEPTRPDELTYRVELADLARHLASLSENRRPVLATLDPVIYSWWLTFTGGYSFLAEAFVSTTSDREAERRLAVYCKILGATPDQYVSFLKLRGTLWFWLGANKYQASRAFAFAPASEYEPDVREEIRTGSLYNNFNVALPSVQVARLERDFLALRPGDLDREELDIIIVTRGGPLSGCSPPVETWRTSFESPRFRVFTRRRPPTQAHLPSAPSPKISPNARATSIPGTY